MTPKPMRLIIPDLFQRDRGFSECRLSASRVGRAPVFCGSGAFRYRARGLSIERADNGKAARVLRSTRPAGDEPRRRASRRWRRARLEQPRIAQKARAQRGQRHAAFLAEGMTAGTAGPGMTGTPDQNSAEDRKSTRLNSSHITISYAV